MSESKNPFGASASAQRRRRSRSMMGWILALLMTAAAVVSVLTWTAAEETIRGLENLYELTRREAQARLKHIGEETKLVRKQQAGLQSRLSELEAEKNAAQEASKKLEEDMRADLESKDVTISKLQGKLTVSIVDRVMFNSGEAVLKPDGESVLLKVAALLTQHPELKIHVIGHTDNVPIRNRFASNWELSTARALAAVHFLTETAGVAPDRVGALGYGEFRPIADNSTAEGRAKNRRIAITILPDEFAGLDTLPTVQTLQTNAPVLPEPVVQPPVESPVAPPDESPHTL